MKAIGIPPIPHLKDFVPVDGYQKMHLVLSHLLENKEYHDHYKILGENGHTLILDNSAHELKSGQDIRTLLNQAIDICASEIVLPDVLFKASLTYNRTEEAIKELKELFSPFPHEYKFTFMVVPQGETELSYVACLYNLANLFYTSFPGDELTIGFSKDYDNWTHGMFGLNPYQDKFRYIIDNFSILTFYMQDSFGWSLLKPFPIKYHFLGWAKDLWYLGSCREYTQIRSIDSARPFVYAKDEIVLDKNDPVPTYPHRSENYFTEALTDSQLKIAEHNMQVFREEAGDVQENTHI